MWANTLQAVSRWEVSDMTKAAALHQFFSSFGMMAYTSTSVPEDAVFPYLTYELITSAWECGRAANEDRKR